MIFTWNKEHTHDFMLQSKNAEPISFVAWPGVNKVKGENEKLLKEDFFFKRFADNGSLTIENKADEINERGIISDEVFLEKLLPVNAKKLISETSNKSTLESWLETEKRRDVRQAIENQLKEIIAPIVKPEEE